MAIGALVDIGGSFLVGAVYTIGYVAFLTAEGVAPDDMEARTLSDPAYLVVTIVIGLALMLVGGYVAGRVARTREIEHGGMVGVVSVAIGFLFLFSDTGTYPNWYFPVSFGLTIPAGLLGGYIARRRAVGTEASR